MLTVTVWARYYAPNYGAQDNPGYFPKLLHPAPKIEPKTFTFDLLNPTVQDEWLFNQLIGAAACLAAIRDKNSDLYTVHWLWRWEKDEPIEIQEAATDPVKDQYRRLVNQFKFIFDHMIELVNNYLPAEVIARVLSRYWGLFVFTNHKYHKLREANKSIYYITGSHIWIYSREHIPVGAKTSVTESRADLWRDSWNSFCRRWRQFNSPAGYLHGSFASILAELYDRIGDWPISVLRINHVIIAAIVSNALGFKMVKDKPFEPSNTQEEFAAGAYATISAALMMYNRYDAGVNDHDHWVASHLWEDIAQFARGDSRWANLKEAYDYLGKQVEAHRITKY